MGLQRIHAMGVEDVSEDLSDVDGEVRLVRCERRKEGVVVVNKED